MQLSKFKTGFYLALGTAVISGLANFTNKFAMQVVGKDAFQYTTLKNAVPAIFLSILVLTPLIFSKLKLLKKREWLVLVLIGIVGGGIPFLLFFKGLSLTSAVTASFIHKTMFIWVAILAIPFLKEKITKMQFLALGLLFGGNIIFGGLKNFTFGYAEILILIATVMWAAENIIAKKVLANVSSLVVGWARMFFGVIVLLGFLAITKNTNGFFALNLAQSGWLALVGILLTGYVLTWYAALKKLPATIVTCILVLASPITALLNSIFITHQFNHDLIGSILFCVIGLLIFTKYKSRQKEIYAFNHQN